MNTLRTPNAELAQQPIKWRCPKCQSTELTELPTLLSCAQCELRFPVLREGQTKVPFLFKNPEATLTAWWARYNGFLSVQNGLSAALEQGLNHVGLSRARRATLESELAARRAHVRDITRVLKPLISAPGWPEGDCDISQSRAALPWRQGLDSYFPNVFRDWCWGNSESVAQLSALQEIIAPVHLGRRMLVAGSGAGRLGVDLHHWNDGDQSVLMDINPLLSLIGARVTNGEQLSLYEFPQGSAPFRTERRHRRSRQDGPQRRNCSSPFLMQRDRSLEFVCADLLHAPFSAGHFDSVVTPWLIDILPHDLGTTVPLINALLPVGGHWINSGSWMPSNQPPERQYSESELMEICLSFGFELIASAHKRIPYLQRPNAAQRRSERVWSFCLRKVADTSQPADPGYLPSWATQPNTAVPIENQLDVLAAQRLLEAQVLSAVDGERSVQDIASSVARKYDLPSKAAKEAVTQILLETLTNRH